MESKPKFVSVKERIEYKKRMLEKAKREQGLVEESFSSIRALVWYCYPAVIISIIILLLFFCGKAGASEVVDLNKIMMIESGGDQYAHNKKNDDRGLYQITPICLEEFNNLNPRGKKYSANDLWDAKINTEIADWYLNKRIPQMLKFFRVKDNTRNRIIAYNAGIKTMQKNMSVPKTTERYLAKYFGSVQ